MGSPALFILLQSQLESMDTVTPLCGERQLSDYLSIGRDRIGQRTGNIEGRAPKLRNGDLLARSRATRCRR
jgi:hypothetical protein